MLVSLVVLALRGAVAVLVLTTLVGGVPRIGRVALAATLGLWSAILVAPGAEPVVAPGLAPAWVVGLREVALGGGLGVIAAIPLLAATTAGRLVDTAATGRPHGPYAAFFGVLAAAVFVGIDGHVAAIGAIAQTHDAMPVRGPLSAGVLGAVARLVPAAVQLSLPWLVTAAVVQIASAVGARVGGRTGAHAPVSVAVPAAVAMLSASLVATLAVAIANLVRAATLS